MNKLTVRNWSEISEKPISEMEIRKRFPAPDFRVSQSVYRHDEARPPGSAREGLCFVATGKCRCQFGGASTESIVLVKGQYVEFPSGDYRIEPLNGQDAVIVKVWNLLALASSGDGY